MNNLVIGNSSQLSYYFPEDYVKISSRNINYDYILSNEWDSVYICAGESRKFISEINLYNEVNFDLTISIINKIKNFCKKIVIYSTCELWNKYTSKINIEYPFDFFSSPYLNSKHKLTKYLIDENQNYNNVVILFPFNFNSIYRPTSFLFGKIFDSIINKKQIEIGNTYFYRDIVHPKYIIERSINSQKNEIVGSGRLVFVNDFIQDLYKSFNMNYYDFVIEDKSKFIEYEKINEYYLDSKNCNYSYSQLLIDTVKDIEFMIK